MKRKRMCFTSASFEESATEATNVGSMVAAGKGHLESVKLASSCGNLEWLFHATASPSELRRSGRDSEG
jgi:hypothetical protein